jgi:hypothetical protein
LQDLKLTDAVTGTVSVGVGGDADSALHDAVICLFSDHSTTVTYLRVGDPRASSDVAVVADDTFWMTGVFGVSETLVGSATALVIDALHLCCSLRKYHNQYATCNSVFTVACR